VSCLQVNGLPATPFATGGSDAGMESSANRKMAAKIIPENIFLQFMGCILLYPPFLKRLLASLPFDLFDLIRSSFFVEEI
jgi:hypothetical protein